MMLNAPTHHFLDRYARDDRGFFVAANRIDVTPEWGVRSENIYANRDKTEDDRWQGNATEFVRHDDKKKYELHGEKEFEEYDLSIFYDKSVFLACVT
jgi:hypothetical protein